MTKPLVSVLINTYNHERFIGQALESAIDQTFPADQTEIIVVDDGSTDSTPQLIEPFLPRIRYVRKQNGGQVSAFNAGLAEAHGDILAFLDGDDWWTRDKLSVVVEAFASHPDVSCVGHAYYQVDETGSILSTMTPTMDRMSLANPEIARLSASLRVFLGTSRLAMRRVAVDRVLPVPPDLPFFDNFISTQGVAISGAALLMKPLCYYRLHRSNLYASNSRDRRFRSARYRLLSLLLQYLPQRLSSLGIPEETVAALLAGDRLEAERSRLSLSGGKRIETFRVERACFHLGYRNPDMGYRFFKYFVLSLTILLPARAFYRVRDWYADHNLHSLRKHMGGATLTVPEVSPNTDLGGKTPRPSVRI